MERGLKRAKEGSGASRRVYPHCVHHDRWDILSHHKREPQIRTCFQVEDTVDFGGGSTDEQRKIMGKQLIGLCFEFEVVVLV